MSNVNIEVMMDILDIEDLDVIQEQDIKRLRIKAKRRWHSDTIHHQNPDAAQVSEFNHKFNLVDDCIELLTAYLNGEVHMGAFTNAETGEIEVTEELKSKVKDMAADLRTKWAFIKKNSIDLVKESVLIRAARPLKEVWKEWDEQSSDEAPLLLSRGIIWGAIRMWVWISVVMIAGEELTPYIKGHEQENLISLVFLGAVLLSGIVVLWKPIKQILLSIIINIPCWNYIFPQFVTKAYEKSMRNIFTDRKGEPRERVSRPFGIFYLATAIINIPFSFISKGIVSIPFIGSRMIGERRATKKYYSGYADWYIKELLEKDIDQMNSDDLQAVLHLYTNYKDLQVKTGKKDKNKPDYSTGSREPEDNMKEKAIEQ